MKELNYWDRLRQLPLMSLQRTRERYIILHMWKVLNSTTSNDLNIEFFHRPRLGNQAKVPAINKTLLSGILLSGILCHFSKPKNQ